MIDYLFGVSDDAEKNKKIDAIFLEYDGNSPLIGFDNSSGEYAAQFAKISYCPICGKKLEVGEADEN
jgi:hypothetical protein